jgi:hypothetical protein
MSGTASYKGGNGSLRVSGIACIRANVLLIPIAGAEDGRGFYSSVPTTPGISSTRSSKGGVGATVDGSAHTVRGAG